MHRYAVVLMWLGILFVAGCASSGGANHVATAGKNLKGMVANGRYTAPDKSFTVALPYAEKSPEWQYMKVNEGRDGGRLTYVEFGPVQGPVIGPQISDNNLYSATFVEHPANFESELLPIWAQRVFDNQMQTIAGSENIAPQQVTFKKTWINGKAAIYAVYALDSLELNELTMTGSTRHYLVFCLINYDAGAANIMARVDPAQSYRIEQELRAGKWQRFNQMALSFRPSE